MADKTDRPVDRSRRALEAGRQPTALSDRHKLDRCVAHFEMKKPRQSTVVVADCRGFFLRFCDCASSLPKHNQTDNLLCRVRATFGV